MMAAPVPVTAEDLARLLARECPPAGIELAGAVALPCPLPHKDRWLRWVAEGRDGNLEYLRRDPEQRADPTRRNLDARSLLIMAHRYTAGWPKDRSEPAAGGWAPEEASWLGRVSRYARGRDYHVVLLKAMRRVLQGLKQEWPDLAAHASTDTGPYLEREYAWLAGLGFLGHNRCLIHETLGSGLFLGVALTNLEIAGLPPGGAPAPEPLFALAARQRRPITTAPWDRCGNCSRCLDACPTGALDLVHGLDAHLCLSSWTIEWRGRAPQGREHEQGGILFGCDICQAVCPWNRKADRKAEGLPDPVADYAPLEEHRELTLADLVDLSDDEFRRRFRRTPIWRCHPEGIRRNAARVRSNLRKGADPT
ncbi:hypothetical protein CSA17_04325 [bacterium DOLJORAL78_65_58]|nr:MAG: hypothetical protein CSB20_04720 [bacterium DOLZORAL124_64_63]PIE76039.1 MAG: hypothetical protein CSA17_04325 [bacterium DOLJORAL78_65_58]